MVSPISFNFSATEIHHRRSLWSRVHRPWKRKVQWGSKLHCSRYPGPFRTGNAWYAYRRGSHWDRVREIFKLISKKIGNLRISTLSGNWTIWNRRSLLTFVPKLMSIPRISGEFCWTKSEITTTLVTIQYRVKSCSSWRRWKVRFMDAWWENSSNARFKGRRISSVVLEVAFPLP